MGLPSHPQSSPSPAIVLPSKRLAVEGHSQARGVMIQGRRNPNHINGAATLTDTVAAAVSALTLRYPPPSDHSELGDCSPPSSARGIRQWLAVSSGFCLRLCVTLLPAISEVSQGAIARLPPHQQPKAISPSRAFASASARPSSPPLVRVSQGTIARLPPHQQLKASSPGRSSNLTPTDRISSASFQRTGSAGTGFS